MAFIPGVSCPCADCRQGKPPRRVRKGERSAADEIVMALHRDHKNDLNRLRVVISHPSMPFPGHAFIPGRSCPCADCGNGKQPRQPEDPSPEDDYVMKLHRDHLESQLPPRWGSVNGPPPPPLAQRGGDGAGVRADDGASVGAWRRRLLSGLLAPPLADDLAAIAARTGSRVFVSNDGVVHLYDPDLARIRGRRGHRSRSRSPHANQ